LPSFDSHFNEKYLIGAKETRRRKFDPQKLFISVLHLVSGKNHEGYLHALMRTWDLFSDLKDMPVKSALVKMRKRISFEFFKDCFDHLIFSYDPHRRTWRGLRVYATDGDRYDLPRSEDVLSYDYRGYPFSRTRETHYPHMYAVHCYDVLSGVTKDFRFSNANDEVALGVEAATAVESASVTLYDRLFLNKNLIRAHQSSKSYFIVRCKSGGIYFKAITEFTESLKTNDFFEFEGERIELVKINHPESKEEMVYATNLPRSRFKNTEIDKLYALRWEVETSHRDLTSTLKMEQWHSKTLNGLLQEIYMTLWWMNQARIQMASSMKKRCRLDELFDYKKANFKLISDFIIDSLDDLLAKRSTRLNRRIKLLLSRSTERRKRRSRHAPRQLRKRHKPYTLASFATRSTK
jgi:hypothetical protein